MRVTIEVANEAKGQLTAKRTVLIRDDYTTDEEMESAAIAFIREAKIANEAALELEIPVPEFPPRAIA